MNYLYLKGLCFYVEQGLKCFQNDEVNVEVNDVDMIEEDLCVEDNDVGMIEEDLCVEANDVGMIEEDLCDTIWNVTKNCIDQKPAPIIKGDQTSECLMLYMIFQWHNCLYQNQDEVVADQFWICGGDILRSNFICIAPIHNRSYLRALFKWSRSRPNS